MKIQVCELFLKNEKEKKIRWKIRHEQFDTKQIERKKNIFVGCLSWQQSINNKKFLYDIHSCDTNHKKYFHFRFVDSRVIVVVVWGSFVLYCDSESVSEVTTRDIIWDD